MTFMVVDTDSYDVLLGLDFLMTIGVVVDVERGLIQVRHDPRSNVEVLPLTMVNLLQRMNFKAMMHEATTIWKNAHTKDDCDWIPDQDCVIMTKEDDASTSDSDTGTDGSGHGDSDSNRLKQVECEDEFRDTELEALVKSEGS